MKSIPGQWDYLKSLDKIDRRSWEYQEIIPSRTVRLSTEPVTIDPKIHPQFSRDMHFVSAPGAIVLFKNAVFHSGDRSIRTADGEFVPVFTEGLDTLRQHPARIKVPKEIRTGKKTVASLFAVTDSYYAWQVRILSKLYLLMKSGLWKEIDHFLAGDCPHEYQQSLFRHLGIANKIVYGNMFTAVKAGRLVVAASPLEISPWTCSALKKFLPLHKAPLGRRDELHGLKRVYISRDDAKNRRVTNEDDVVVLLKGYGFRKVILAGLNIADQVRLFRNAEVIIGPHGSGFVNAACCRPGTRIIEFFSPEYVRTMFRGLADECALDYGYLLCQKAGAGRPSTGRLHMTVNRDRLAATLELMGITRRCGPRPHSAGHSRLEKGQAG